MGTRRGTGIEYLMPWSVVVPVKALHRGKSRLMPAGDPWREDLAIAFLSDVLAGLQAAGVLLARDGLHPPSMGARVSFENGKPRVTDGPFSEVKEVLGGYWMIQVASKDEATAWAKRCPASPNEVIEIRQVQEFADFPEDVQRAAAALPEMQSDIGQR